KMTTTNGTSTCRGQPAKNKVKMIADTVNMAADSARKKRANIIHQNIVLYNPPATWPSLGSSEGKRTEYDKIMNIYKKNRIENIQDSDVNVRDHHRNTKKRAAEWNDRDGDNRRHHRETRGKPVVKCVYMARAEILLQQQFKDVGNRLEESGRANAIRSSAILNERADLAFRINAVGNHRQND